MAPGASEYDLDDERVYGFAALAVTAGVALLVGVLLGVGVMLVVPKPGVPRPAASASAPAATPRPTRASASAQAATPRTAASDIPGSHAAAQLVPPVRNADGPFDPGQGGVPAGWVRYFYFSRGPASTSGGWSIATPGWIPEPAGQFLRLREPGYGYVAVATQPGAGSSRDLVAGLAGAFASQSGYRNLGVRAMRFRAADATDWEFTYRDSGTDLHALVRGFVLHGAGYLVWFQTRTSDWASAQGQRSAMLASFRA